MSRDEPSVCSHEVSLGTLRNRNFSIEADPAGALLDPLEGCVDDELAGGRSRAGHLSGSYCGAGG